MSYPATPHMAEEWNSYLGNKITLAETIIDDPHVDEDDVLILAEEGALKNLIDSAWNVKGLAERHSEKPVSRLVIQTTPDWKFICSLKPCILQILNSTSCAKDCLHSATRYVCRRSETRRSDADWHTLTIGSKKTRGRALPYETSEKALIRSKHDETASIKSAISFIADAIDIKSIASMLQEKEKTSWKGTVCGSTLTWSCFPLNHPRCSGRGPMRERVIPMDNTERKSDWGKDTQTCLRAIRRFETKIRPMGIPENIDPEPETIEIEWPINPVLLDVQKVIGKLIVKRGEFGWLEEERVDEIAQIIEKYPIGIEQALSPQICNQSREICLFTSPNHGPEKGAPSKI